MAHSSHTKSNVSIDLFNLPPLPDTRKQSTMICEILFCSSQDRLWPLPVKQTQGTQPLLLFIQFLLQFIISKINVGYHTV